MAIARRRCGPFGDGRRRRQRLDCFCGGGSDIARRRLVTTGAIDLAGSFAVKVLIRSAMVTIVLAVMAGLGGMWLGHQMLTVPARGYSLHDIVHEELSLMADQKRHLDTLETPFAARREALEGEMRSANAELAAAIRGSEVAGPAVEAAVLHFHDAMGALQTETIEHIFAMRKVLTPDQRKRFNDTIGQALTAGVE